MRQLAETIVAEMALYPEFADHARNTVLQDTSEQDYFGAGYEDVQLRVPSIAEAKQYLAWTPHTSITEGIKKTLTYYFGIPKHD